MKKKFRLLIGLGIVFALSITVPVFATESSGSINIESDSSSASSDSKDTESDSSSESSDSKNTESDSSSESSDSNNTGSDNSSESSDSKNTESDNSTESTETIIDNITVTWQQDKETEDHIGEWYLILTDTSKEPATTSMFKGTGAYKVGEKTYYFSEGYLLAGFIPIEAEPDTAAVETDIVPDTSLKTGKTYYFDIEGTDPSKDGVGSLVTGEDQWLILSDETDELPDEWYYLTADGDVDLTMVGIQQIDEEQWIYINNDHTLAPWESGWYLIDDTAWYYLAEDLSESESRGVRDKTKIGYVEIEGAYYYLNEDGTPKTGIIEINGKKYYFSNQDGGKRSIATGWQLLDGNLLYFNSLSEIANSRHNGWLEKFDNWYYFQNGTMKTGWVLSKNLWYYLDPATGIMETGWFKVKDTTYYANASGTMLSGWQKINGTWYHFGSPSDGAMKKSCWLKSGNLWYYLDSDGKMLTGWQTIKGKTYYLDTINGDMKYGWVKLNGKWYFFGAASDGAMKTGFYKDGATTYYSDPETGIMQTGWLLINDIWYYFYPSGAMAANKWVGDYYLLSNGKMATSQWVGKYWVGEDGKWIPNYDPDTFAGKWVQKDNIWYYQRSDGSYLSNQWKKIDSIWYYFKSNGAMVTGWQYIGGYKYYFASSGKLMQDLDGILAKQSSYRATVNRVKCQVMIYAYDSATNKYCIPVKTFACSVGLPSTPTPTGTFSTSQKIRWHELMGPSYGQYCTRITDGILFHSVASPKANNNNLPASEFNKLGSPASHGCVRLCVRDAKWIYDYCPLGMKVTINDTAYTPFDKPATIKIPATQTWDPTDPAFS